MNDTRGAAWKEQAYSNVVANLIPCPSAMRNALRLIASACGQQPSSARIPILDRRWFASSRRFAIALLPIVLVHFCACHRDSKTAMETAGEAVHEVPTPQSPALTQETCHCGRGDSQLVFDGSAALYSVYFHAYQDKGAGVPYDRIPKAFRPVPLECAIECLKRPNLPNGRTLRHLALRKLVGGIRAKQMRQIRHETFIFLPKANASALERLLTGYPVLLHRIEAMVAELVPMSSELDGADGAATPTEGLTADEHELRERLETETEEIVAEPASVAGDWTGCCDPKDDDVTLTCRQTVAFTAGGASENVDVVKVEIHDVVLDAGLDHARRMIDPLNWPVSGMFTTAVVAGDPTACPTPIPSPYPVPGAVWKGVLSEYFKAVGGVGCGFWAQNLLNIETAAVTDQHRVDYGLCKYKDSGTFGGCTADPGDILVDCGCISAEAMGTGVGARVDALKYIAFSEEVGNLYSCVSMKVMGDLTSESMCCDPPLGAPLPTPQPGSLERCGRYLQNAVTDLPPLCGSGWSGFDCSDTNVDYCDDYSL